MISNIRTIGGCLDKLKELDPDTAITKYYLYSLVSNPDSKFKAFEKAGTKYLINFDKLLLYLEEFGNAS